MIKWKFDFIKIGPILISLIGMLGGFWAYCEGHFATKDSVVIEREERRELKLEVNALYLKFIPESERIPLKHLGN